MVIVDNEILQGFYQEARGYIPDIRSGMKALKSAPRDREAAAEVHRLVHSIKGAASMVGLSTLSHIAYLAEEAIEEATEGKTADYPPDLGGDRARHRVHWRLCRVGGVGQVAGTAGGGRCGGSSPPPSRSPGGRQ